MLGLDFVYEWGHIGELDLARVAGGDQNLLELDSKHYHCVFVRLPLISMILVPCVTIVVEIIIIKRFRQRSYLPTSFVRETNQPHGVSVAKSLI